MNPVMSKDDSSIQADLVVIGGGGSGLTAAVTAKEAGLKNIIVLEANNAPGGNSLFPGGIMGAETPLQKRLGVDAPRDMVYQKFMEYGHWKLNGRLVRRLIDISGDTIRWLENKGVVFEQLTPHYPNPLPNTFHAIRGKGRVRTGAVIVKTLVQCCRDMGINIMLRTSGKKLLTDCHGDLCGVLAVSPKGEHSIIAKCVITATGGFSGNVELIKRYDPSYDEDEMIHGGMRHKGDGMQMAMEIGAATDKQVMFEMFGPSFSESMRLTLLSKRPSTIWVNKNGGRFADENTRSDMEAANILYRQPHKLCYSLLDEVILNSCVQDTLAPLELMMMDEKTFREGMKDDLKLQEKEGRIAISNSWEKIAAWIGANPEVLRSTLKEYNNSCDHGYDEVFLKDRRFLIPLRKPPFYAIPGKISIVVTHGGLLTNHLMEVLNNDGKVIPGLFAAGIEIAGTEANTYNIFISGHSFGFAIFSGRIAGEQAARYVISNR